MPKTIVPKANEVLLLKVMLIDGCGEDFSKEKIYRIIAVKPSQTLDKLHNAIYRAFDRYDEHLWMFTIGKPYHRDSIQYSIMPEDDELSARRAKIEDIPWNDKRKVYYVFDFGDDWFHQVTAVGTAPLEPKKRYPLIIESHGESPEQYPDYEEEDDDDDDDDDFEDEELFELTPELKKKFGDFYKTLKINPNLTIEEIRQTLAHYDSPMSPYALSGLMRMVAMIVDLGPFILMPFIMDDEVIDEDYNLETIRPAASMLNSLFFFYINKYRSGLFTDLLIEGKMELTIPTLEERTLRIISEFEGFLGGLMHPAAVDLLSQSPSAFQAVKILEKVIRDIKKLTRTPKTTKYKVDDNDKLLLLNNLDGLEKKGWEALGNVVEICFDLDKWKELHQS